MPYLKKSGISGCFLCLCFYFVMAASADAYAENPDGVACPYYGGYINVEGRLGGRRSIGDTSLFIPVVCSQDVLLFSDIRFKADSQKNREGNIGLGLRFLKQNGVTGGYAYFDRKKSGITDKYHSQLTVGAEWLAEAWEVRANGYVPLTDEAEVITGISSLSDPFLSGSGIFVHETAARVLRETPLYGGDIEAGFKLPGIDFWLHTGAFSFSGDNAPSLDGARVRATYQLTEHIAFTAEGQYDDERGQQGWLGARLTIPFGGQPQKPEGPAARMTASPVRDVDIVTQTVSETKGSDGIVPVLNTVTGTAQQVVYVDNALPVNGNGTLENPFNNLNDAQAQLAAQGVLYISTGMNYVTQDGLTLSAADTGVLVIGEGAAFIYDSERFTTNTGDDFTGAILREAGTAPKITNVNASGDGITILTSDIFLTGVTVENAERYGVYAVAAAGNVLDNITLSNITVEQNAEDGIRIEARDTNSAITVSLSSVEARENKNGIRFYAHDDASSVTGTVSESLVTENDQHGVILHDDAASASVNVDVDLGGGGRSEGLNGLFGNTLEDIAIDIDGGVLFALNNWWGQPTGLYQSSPSGGLAPQIYYGAPINDGLVGHWTFDEEWTNGTTAYDRSGNGRDGTWQGGLLPANDMVEGRYRQGLEFDGVNDRVNLPASNALLSGDTSFTLFSSFSTGALHSTVNPNVGGRLLTLRTNAASTKASNYLRGDNADTLGFFSGPATSINKTSSGYNDDVSHLLASAYDAGTNILRVYYDGTAPVSQNVGQLSNAGPDTAIIGSFTAGEGFINGIIEDTRIYNRVLSADEIAELYRMDTTSAVESGALSGAYLTANPGF